MCPIGSYTHPNTNGRGVVDAGLVRYPTLSVRGCLQARLDTAVRNQRRQVALQRCFVKPSRFWPQARLDAAVRNQRRLAAWHALQYALTRALDYGGAIISYCCVALAIFHSAPAQTAATLASAAILSLTKRL